MVMVTARRQRCRHVATSLSSEKPSLATAVLAVLLAATLLQVLPEAPTLRQGMPPGSVLVLRVCAQHGQRLCLRGGGEPNADELEQEQEQEQERGQMLEQSSESESNMVDEDFEKEAEQLIDRMEEHMHSPPDFLPIVEKLWNASELSKGHRIEIMRYGATRKLCSMLPIISDRQCLIVACKLLENLCLDDDSQILFCQLSGMDKILKLMRNYAEDYEVLVPMLSILTNALLLEKNRQNFAKSDGLDFVLESMERFKSIAIMQEKCCAVISNSAREMEVRKKLGNEKVISLVHEAMKGFPEDRGVLQHTCHAFMNIAFEDDKRRDMIRAQEGHKTVKNITKRFKVPSCSSRSLLSCHSTYASHLGPRVVDIILL
eukprot:753000-Hanusia_phi.AAC.9